MTTTRTVTTTTKTTITTLVVIVVAVVVVAAAAAAAAVVVEKEEDEEAKEEKKKEKELLLFIGCLTSQQHAYKYQGRCAQTIAGAATQKYNLQIKLATSHSHSILTPINPSTVHIRQGALNTSLQSTNYQVTGMARPGKSPRPGGERDLKPGPLLSRRTPYC